MNDLARFEWQRTFAKEKSKYAIGIVWLKAVEAGFAEALAKHIDKWRCWKNWHAAGMRYFEVKKDGVVVEKWFEYRGRRLEYPDYARLNGGFGIYDTARAQKSTY